MKLRSLVKHSVTGWLVKLLAGLGLMLASTHAATTEPYGLDAMAQFERLPFLKIDMMSGGQSSDGD